MSSAPTVLKKNATGLDKTLALSKWVEATAVTEINGILNGYVAHETPMGVQKKKSNGGKKWI